MKFASLLIHSKKNPPSPRERRLRRLIIGLVLYTIVGFLVLPAIIKWQLVKQLPKFTHRQAAVRQVRLNPYALSLTIRGLALTETNGEPFAAFEEFYANFQLSSLFHWAWTFDEIRLTHPTASLVRFADGQFNFSNLITPATNPPSQTIPRVLVHRFAITNGLVTVTDHTRTTPFHTDYGPTDLELKNFTTRRQKDGPYSFIATTGEGESFAWSGTVSVNPPQSAGEFRLAGIPLKKYAPYAAEFTTAQIADGILDIAAAYRLDATAKPLQLDISNAVVDLRQFDLKMPTTGESALTITNLLMTNTMATLAGHELRVPLINLHGGSTLARREADGKLNLLNLLVPRTNTPVIDAFSTETNNSPGPAWKLLVDEIDVAGFNVTVEDRTTPRPMTLGLGELRINVKGFSNQSNAPVNVSAAFVGSEGGSAQLQAKGTLLPPAAEATFAATNLPLAPLQPYAEQFSHLLIHSGAITSEGKLRYAPDKPGEPLIHFEADVKVADFRLSETLSSQELARWDSHTQRGIKIDLGSDFLPQRARIDEIKFTGLTAGVTILSNGQPNVLALMKSLPSTAGQNDSPPGTNAAKKSAEFPIEIGSFVLEKTSLRAVDQSLKPRFNTTVEEINGSIRDLTWPKLSKSAIDLRGKVSALAPFEITGTIIPDVKEPFVDLKLAFKNSDLTPFSPYSEKFAGHPVNKGKLSFDFLCRIENRALNASNVLAIDQLTLGPRNNSTNATKLPVKLAVALLKDRNGRIDLSLPVTGSLDDPKFSIGGVVLKVFVNLLVKVATSPFALLGAMFGGGEELQYVDFAPGSTAIAAAQAEKLDKLTKALFDRPALNLEISASADPVADREAVTRQKLKNAIKTMRIEELASRGKPTPALAGLQLEDSDYERLLRKAYKDAFNTTPERALREARAAAAATNAPKPQPIVGGTAQAVEIKKGGVQLVQSATIKSSSAPAPGPDRVNHAPSKPKTEDELIREELERRMAATVAATDDDLRDLMQQRAQAVQKLLLDSGKVTAERLFLVAPRPIDPDAKSLPRVIFSLN